MKVLFVSDLLDGWSIHNTYKAFVKYIPNITFDIVEGNKISLAEFYDKAKNFDLVHLFYTCGIDKFIEYVRDNYSKCIVTIVNERTMAAVVNDERSNLEEIFSTCRILTSVSKKMAEEYEGIYIPNGVNLDIFKEEKRNVVGFIGTETVNKGIFLLRKVCKDLNLELLELLYGKNQVPYEEMYKQYKKMSVLVLPSESEGCSNVVLEALSMNIPVITTKTGIWQDLQDYVMFVDLSYNSLRNALRKYSTRKFINDNFNWITICKKYEEVYNAIYGRMK